MDLTTRPILGLSEAATATALHRRTITRMLADGRIIGAGKDDEGRWLIPVEALLAAGLKLHEPAPGNGGTGEAVEAGAVDDWADLEQQHLNDLAIMRAEAKKHDELVEALQSTIRALESKSAALSANLDDLRLQVRMLAPGSVEQAARRLDDEISRSHETSQKAAPTMPSKRLRWWHRA